MRTLRIALTFLSLIVMIACKPEQDITDPEDVSGTVENNRYVNTWMRDILDDYYYWNYNLKTGVDKTLAPDEYFDKCLYWYNDTTATDGDRFSWIMEDYTELQDYLQGVVSNEIGFDMTFYYMDSIKTNLVGQVNYVKKGTPAEAVGIKRGMLFNKIDNIQLTKSNYSNLTLFSGAQHTFNFVTPVYDNQDSVMGFQDSTSIPVQTVTEYAEDPVYFDTVYTQIPGHKIGYLVYHFFASDDGSNNSQYDLELNAVFGRFKNAEITDLILDLRYNSGGSIVSAVNLASAIVPNLSTSNVLTYFRYNTGLNQYYIQHYGLNSMNEYFNDYVKNASNVSLEPINNVGNQLNGKLYVLTGHYTASASELIINGLKPYMDVVLVGDTTYGKNVASTTFYDEENTDKNKWGLQPIIAKYFNSLGYSDFTSGFVPNENVQDGGAGMLEYGNVNERLLKYALDCVQGLVVPSRVQLLKSDAVKTRWNPLTGRSIRGLQIENPFFLK
jgi:carboxyl-terminal processing protease